MYAMAQERQRLAGYIQIPGKRPTSYYIDIIITGTAVKGYSITDWEGGNRLKAALVGVRSPASEMSIQETASLDGPSSLSRTYCYFSGRLKLSVMNGRQRWSGQFESHQLDGTPCESGYMTLTDDAPSLDPVPAPKPKPIPPPPKPKPKPIPPVAAPIPKQNMLPDLEPMVASPPPKKDPPKPVTVIQITRPAPSLPPDTCMRRYSWTSDLLSLDISDGWTIDGDIVSLSLNGQTFMDHARLSKEMQHFSMPLAPGLNVLNVFLHDDGIDPPNTPNLILYDGTKKYELAISGETNETVKICIERRK